MKFQEIILIFVLFNFSQFVYCEGQVKPISPWCWTKPVKGEVKVLPENGGVNWGFCQLPEPGGDGAMKIPYRIFIVTPNIKGAGAIGQFFLKMTGVDGETDEFILSSEGFVEGTTTIVNAVAKSVGDINKIVMRTSGTDVFQCSDVRIELETKFWDFDCQEELSCPRHCSSTLTLAGAQKYDITTQTASKEGSDSKAPIYIILLGTEGKSAKKILSENGFNAGSVVRTTITARDIGQIYGIILSETVTDPWGPEKVSVKRAGKEESVYLAKGGMVNCPVACSLQIMNPKPDAIQGADEEGGDDEEKQCDNDYGGCGLTTNEKNSMLQLTCDTVVIGNADFGPMVTGKPNYQLYIAKCPGNCHEKGDKKVFGVGIHPQQAGICKSAIYDLSMPIFGGVIGVGIQPGLNTYQKGKTIFGVDSKKHGKTSKSFYTIKIDNFDMAEKNMRIIDNEGQPSFRGRIEFRNQGEWGSVCQNGVNNQAARTICRELQFLDGLKKNGPGDSAKMCNNYLGENYCGPTPSRIHYQSIRCEPGAQEVMKCYRELADQCKHDSDLIIECVNINYDLPQEPDMGNIRIVDGTGQPSNSRAGRLEMYRRSWGSVCNSKFTEKSAQVACKQMGYDDGKLVGNLNENGVCTSFNGDDHCGPDTMPIQVKNIECAGTEAKITDCGGIADTSSCSHEQDTIIQCEGNGDPTGMNQKEGFGKRPLAPETGKLPLPPIIKLECNTQGNEPIFRGDPGSIYIVECPAGCTAVSGTVWGTSIYLVESSICKSAIHAGVLQDNGGIIEYVIKEGQEKYESSTNRGITSIEYDGWKFSFVVAKPVSIHIELSIAFASKPKVLMFSQMNQQIVLQKMNNKSQLFKNFLSKSMVMFAEKEPLPVFQWNASPLFKFDGEHITLKTELLPGADQLSELTQFTMIMKVKLDDFDSGKEVTILSHSSCGCWALMINEIGQLVFKQRCETTEVNSGFSMPIDADTYIAVTYDGATFNFIVNGAVVQTEKLQFIFKCQGALDIGSYAETMNQVWHGSIYFVQIFDSVFSPQSIRVHLAKGDPLPIKAKPDSSDDEEPSLPTSGTFLTLDGRTCKGICTTNIIPGMPGAPSPPQSAALGQPDYGPGADVDEGLEEPEGAAPTVVDQINTGDKINCDTPGTDKLVAGPTGKIFRVECPRFCSDYPSGTVVGAMIYNDESSLCKAAIHSGFLNSEKGGEFLVQIANGEERYESSFQNGIQSVSFGASTRAFTIKGAPKIISVTSDTTAQSYKFSGEIGSKYAVLCPKDCTFQSHAVFGIDVYADSSNICQAAIHAGLLTDQGGEVHFMIVEGSPVYLPLSRNGIVSEKLEGSPRAIRFMGDKTNTCAYFKEEYSPANIFVNWKVQDYRSATGGASQWTFTANPTQYGLSFKQNSLTQGNDYNYGTVLYNRNFDCNDGLFKVNVYFNTLGNAIIMLRYYDEQNFYALELNTPNQKKVRLVKKSEGLGEQIQATDVFFVVGVWYRFRIIFHETNLQVWLQTGNLRNLERLININDMDVQRGTVGIATQAFSDVYFDGISVKNYNPQIGITEPGANKRRVWDQCLVEATKAHRKKFCKAIYGVYQQGIDKCTKLYNYCEQCCDSLIPKPERVLNFACWRGCIRESKEAAKRVLEQKIAEAEMMAALLGLWRPKEGDKCDYKPKILGENSYFVIATVQKEISSDGPKQKLEIKFFVDGAPKTEVVQTPSENLMQCGMALVSRTDCGESRRR